MNHVLRLSILVPVLMLFAAAPASAKRQKKSDSRIAQEVKKVKKAWQSKDSTFDNTLSSLSESKRLLGQLSQASRVTRWRYSKSRSRFFRAKPPPNRRPSTPSGSSYSMSSVSTQAFSPFGVTM